MNPNSPAPTPSPVSTPPPIRPTATPTVKEGLRDFVTTPTAPANAFSAGTSSLFNSAGRAAPPPTDNSPVNANPTLAGYQTGAANIATLPADAPRADAAFPATPPRADAATVLFPDAPAANLAAPAAASSAAPPSNPEAYLDTISAKPDTKKNFLSNKMFVLIGGAVLALIIVIIVSAAVNNVRQTPTQSALALGTELTNLQTLVSYGQSNSVASAKLVKIDAETNLIVMSRQNDLAKVFTLQAKKDSGKTPGPDFVADLDSAKAQGNLDQAYTDALSKQFDAVYTALNALDKQAASDAERGAIAKTSDDIKELYRRLTE